METFMCSTLTQGVKVLQDHLMKHYAIIKIMLIKSILGKWKYEHVTVLLEKLQVTN